MLPPPTMFRSCHHHKKPSSSTATHALNLRRNQQQQHHHHACSHYFSPSRNPLRPPSICLRQMLPSSFQLTVNSPPPATSGQQPISLPTFSISKPEQQQPTSISILSNEIDVGHVTLPSFKHGKKNTTLLKASILNKGEPLESDAASELKKNMKNKNGLPLKVKLDTKVKAKLGKLKTPNVRIRVSCDGIRVHLPAGKKPVPVTASTSKVKCEVDVRFKIWKWTV